MSPIVVARVQTLFSRKHYDDKLFSYDALLALAGATIFFMAATAVAGTHPVFADSTTILQQQQQNAQDAHLAMQTISSNSYIRQVSDSVSVASYFNSPGSKPFAARTIIRGLSDSVGLRSEFGLPEAAQQVSGPVAPREYGPLTEQPPNQKSEERLGQRIMPSNKGESRFYNSAVTQVSVTPTAEAVSSEAKKKDLQGIATPGDSGGGSDPDGNSSSDLLKKTALAASSSSSAAAMNGATVYSGITSSVYCVAIFALAARKTPRLKAKRRTIRLGQNRFAILSVQDPKWQRSGASVGAIVVVVFVVFILAVIMVAAVPDLSPALTGPLIRQAYGDGGNNNNQNGNGQGNGRNVHRAISDSISVSDSISKSVTRRVQETLPLLEGLDAKMPVSIKISDSIKVAEGAKAGRLITIVDILPIGAEVSDISMQWNRNFDESLNLADCDNFSCNQSLHFDEGLAMADTLLTPPRFNETLTLGENITSSQIFTRNLSDPLSISARLDYSVKLAPFTAPGSPLPPISVLVVSNKTNAALPSSIEVPIPPLSWKGDTDMLKEVLKPVPHVVNATVTNSNLPQMTIVLPTYQVPIVPSSEIPGKNVMLSVMAAEVPANTPVMVPINMAEKQETKENATSTFAKSMNIEFTPNVTTTNFALVVSVVDSPPGRVEPPQADLKPLYLDVRWIGDFPGKENPHVAEYYKNPPTFTFTVTDEWAITQQSQRDENGVPVVSLTMLNESTGKWETITDMRRPVSGIDGVYTYVGTLPHFSNYAITANKAVVSENPIVHSSPGMKVSPPVLPQLSNLVVNLADSVSVGDMQKTAPTGRVEEFGQKKLTVSIADSIAILTRPVSFKTFQVDAVDVKITLQDVKQVSVVPPKATAALLVEMVNSGNKEEKFTLDFWYYDEAGKKIWDSSPQLAELRPYESKQLLVHVPFTSHGVFDVIAEAHSFPGKDLVNATRLTVTVPWLTINLYIVMVMAAVILGASGIGTAHLLRRAGVLALIIPRKARPPRVLVTGKEKPTDDDKDEENRYDLIVRVNMKNGLEGEVVVQKPAQFDIDVMNRSRSKLTFVLSYWAMDRSGIRLHEQSKVLKIGASKTEKVASRLDLREGTYIFGVEAKPAKGNEVWSSARLRLTVR